MIVPKPVLEMVHCLKERLDGVDRSVGAAGPSGVDGAHVVQAALYALPLRLPTLTKHGPIVPPSVAGELRVRVTREHLARPATSRVRARAEFAALDPSGLG